jgi:hypothetical protein
MNVARSDDPEDSAWRRDEQSSAADGIVSGIPPAHGHRPGSGSSPRTATSPGRRSTGGSASRPAPRRRCPGPTFGCCSARSTSPGRVAHPGRSTHGRVGRPAAALPLGDRPGSLPRHGAPAAGKELARPRPARVPAAGLRPVRCAGPRRCGPGMRSAPHVRPKNQQPRPGSPLDHLEGRFPPRGRAGGHRASGPVRPARRLPGAGTRHRRSAADSAHPDAAPDRGRPADRGVLRPSRTEDPPRG